MTTPAGTFSYSYDAAGRASSLTNPFSETTSWAYQDNDWLQTQTLANGAVANYTLNPAGQLTRLLNQRSGSTLSDFSSIGYDGAGNRSSMTANIPGASVLTGVTTYQYDTKNQLTQESSTRNGGFSENFGYDPAGNATTFRGVTKAHNSNNQQTGTGFAHDSNGNPSTYASTTLNFDPENRMTAHGTAMTAAYTGDGLRAWKQTAGGRTYFLYDGIVPIVELNPLGVVTATNTFGAAGLVSRSTGIVPLAISVFYTFDPQGSVAQKTDALGLALSTHMFSAHGRILSGTSTDPFGYKAQFAYYTDNETGQQLLTHRYYDSNTGRFLTRDPISYSGGINLYSYTENNPVNFIDPSGLAKGDKWYGYNNRDFRRWFHRCWKRPGDPDAGKEGIEDAYAEWVSRGSPKGDKCWGGGKPDRSACKEPARDPMRRRIPGPSLDEYRMQEESHRQMEKFWTKILIGDAAAGAVLLSPAGAGAAVIRWLTIGGGGRLVPVP